MRRWVTSTLAAILRLFGARAVDVDELERLKALESRLRDLEPKYRVILRKLRVSDGDFFVPSHSSAPPPPGAERYLRADNPRLLELRERYRSLRHPVIDPSLWTQEYVTREVDLRFFRGDYAFVWQQRDMNLEPHYAITAYYLMRNDPLQLLESLDEDDCFGARAITIDGLTVTRDLLDSIVEIHFLQRNLDVTKRSGLKILDVGAGYGRLAHRMIKALPGVERFFAVDAIAESTFVAEYYLRFRGVEDKAVVVPLDELDGTLANHRIDIALNVHSFSECTLASINAWCDLLREHQVPYLMVVPNALDNGGTRLLCTEVDHGRLDYLPALEAHGYRLVSRQPKYLDPSVQRHGISPTHHYLFELTG